MKTIVKALQGMDTFLLTTHVGPDPDALCSELALAEYLRSIGKKVVILNEESVPKRLSFFAGSKRIRSAQTQKPFKYDAAVILDCGGYDRIGGVEKFIDSQRPIINIDHHITNKGFGTHNLVVPTASSTCELLFEVLTLAKCQMTKRMAENLYAGIITDTGSFRYECTSPRTHEIAAELTKFKFSVSNLYKNLYEMIPMADLQAFTKVISHFDSLFSGRVACVELTKKAMDQFSEEFDLRDTVFQFLRSIKGLEAIVILTEIGSKETRINFRSMGKLNVAQVAHGFGGGGHRRASGCKMDADLKVTRKAVLAEIKKRL